MLRPRYTPKPLRVSRYASTRPSNAGVRCSISAAARSATRRFSSTKKYQPMLPSITASTSRAVNMKLSGKPARTAAATATRETMSAAIATAATPRDTISCNSRSRNASR